MADEVIEKETSWFSAELSVLEAEFEKSKLQVYQDTLLCKRSMVELELLCKNERLRENVRVNDKLKEKDSRLQEQLESLSSELKNATSQLQTAQNSLQDEKARHQLEKKELEQKLNSEMETRMEEQRESANRRENVLQEELTTLQNKHLKVFKEAEDLRTELSKKNVAVKTKAIQARVNVKNASTMVQVDSQTCEVGVQVQDLALADDRSRMDGDDVREVNEDLRETSEIPKEKKRVAEAKGKTTKIGMVKEVDKDEVKEGETIHEEGDDKERALLKRKSSRREGVSSQNEAKAMTEKQKTATSTQEELHLEKQFTTQTGKREEFLHERANPSDSLSALNNIPFQYSITPRRLQKLEQNNHKPEKYCDITSGSTQDDITCSVEEGNNSEKQSEVALKEFPRLEKYVQGNSNKDALESAKEILEVDGDGFVENEDVTSEEQKSALIEEGRDVFESRQAGIRLQDEQELPANLGRTDSNIEIQGEKVPGVQDVKEEMRKNGKKESKRRRKAGQIKSDEGEIQEDESKLQEKSEVKSNEKQGGRVLRSKAKECYSGVKLDTKKGKQRKALGTKTRQTRQDSVVKTAVTKKCKTHGWDLKGRELTVLDKSTPETDQLPPETDMSSREIDRLVDEPRPSRQVTTRTPVPIGDETSQQPEPEVLGRLSEGNTCSEGERLRDYTSDQGRLVLNVNRISTLEETIFDSCLHKDLEEGKSACQNGLHPDEKDNNITRPGQQFQGNEEVSVSKKQGLDTIEADSNTHLTRQTAKSTSRDTGRSRRDGQDPPGVSVPTVAAFSKENAPNGKLKGRKKRKPTSSVREVLAPADQQSNSDSRTSGTEIPSMLDCTKRRKALFNSRENSLMAPISNTQISFASTTLSKSRANAGIPPSLSAFMRSFIAPKLKKSL